MARVVNSSKNVDNTPKTPLTLAIDKGDLEIINGLVSAGAPLNSFDDSNLTPLLRAIDKNNLNLVKYLIDRGADIFLQRTKTDQIPLSYAITKGATHTELADFLQKQTWLRVNFVGKDGKTPLIKAVEIESLASVKFLTENGAKTWQLGANGESPLRVAVALVNKGIVKFLLDNHAKCTIPSALCYAIEQNLVEIVQFLVEQGNADPEMNFKDGSNPLTKAIKFQNFKIMAYLIAKGAAITQADRSGNIPLVQLAEFADVTTAKSVIKTKDFINVTDSSGNSALLKSVERGNYDVFKHLISFGANIHGMPADTGKNLLSIAASNRDLPIVIDLIELGAKIKQSVHELTQFADVNDDFACYLFMNVKNDEIKKLVAALKSEDADDLGVKQLYLKNQEAA